MPKDYLIKGVDPDLYSEFKAACAYYRMTAKATLIKHMENIVDDYHKSRQMFDKPKIYKKVKGKK